MAGCLDLGLQLASLFGCEIDFLAGFDFKRHAEIRLDVVERVSLIGHTLGQGLQLAAGGDGARIESLRHVGDLLFDYFHVGCELLLAQLELRQVVGCIIFGSGLLVGNVQRVGGDRQ